MIYFEINWCQKKTIAKTILWTIMFLCDLTVTHKKNQQKLFYGPRFCENFLNNHDNAL